MDDLITMDYEDGIRFLSCGASIQLCWRRFIEVGRVEGGLPPRIHAMLIHAMPIRAMLIHAELKIKRFACVTALIAQGI